MTVFLSFLLFGLWTLAFPVGKYMLQFSPPIFLTGARMLLSGFILIGYLLLKKKIPTLSKKGWGSIAILALFSIYLTNILEFWSLSHLSAAKTCFLYGLSPFLTALLSYLHFNERITPMKWLGITLGGLGFIPALLTKTGTEGFFHAFGGFTWPELSMFGAVFFSVYGWIMLRLIIKDEQVPILFANGSSMLLGGAAALITSFFFESTPIVSGGLIPLGSSIIFLSILSNVLCYNLYGFLLKRLTATFLSLIGLFSPIFASLHSFLLLGETPSPTIFISTLIVLIGLGIVYYEERRLGYITS